MASNGSVELMNGEVLVSAENVPDDNKANVQEFTQDVHVGKDQPLIECDVLVVGAGFSGITAIHRFRKLGLKVKCFESGTGFGGVWYWNRYPGARVDSEAPFYQLNIPEVYRDWNFTERFPNHVELRDYMAHVDKVLNLRKDTFFGARVCDVSWNPDVNLWTVKTQQRHVAQCKYLMLAAGLLHRTYTPDFAGLDSYQGELHHTGVWPESFSAKGKKIAVVGAGATAVQITQELGKQADHLTVFVRRPSYCLPMEQRLFPRADQDAWKTYYPAIFKASRESFTGFPCALNPSKTTEVPVEERESFLEALWSRGGFPFGAANYHDHLTNRDASNIIYDFWRRKTCQRLTDHAKQKIMAPEKAPFYFGTKRNPLEQDYYEVLNQKNVTIHDLGAAPLQSFTQKGLSTTDGQSHEFDAIILATGYDSYTGSLTHMGLKNKDGVELAEIWKGGPETYLGLTIAGFPNMFLSYTPQSPTALSNGTTIIEAQVETIVDMVAKMRSENIDTIEPDKGAQDRFVESVAQMSRMTLLPLTNSWWNGGNIPGKKTGHLVYVGGINYYESQARATFDGWQGFTVTAR